MGIEVGFEFYKLENAKTKVAFDYFEESTTKLKESVAYKRY